jgi:exodeoxyribonuclease VII large subunit
MQHTLGLVQSAEYSVSAISQEIKHLVEGSLSYVRVRGEISGLKIAQSGHGYFNLKDSSSVLACTCWKSSMSRVSIPLEEGAEIVASGRISTYAGQSKYQLSVDKIELSGVGNLMQLLQQRKEQFAKEGLFAPEHKKPLPFLPRTIGVITSITGSVIKDIIHRISDRFPSRILIWPTLVQGDSAAKEITAAIDGFNKQLGLLRPDLIIVARGGGSIEDLWAFNEESVVRAAFNSAIPIISAVGHETDFTLIDLVSDVRAPTPTAAAEFAVPVLKELQNALTNYAIILNKRLASYINYREHLLSAHTNNLDLHRLILQKEQRFDDICLQFEGSYVKYLRIKHFSLGRYDVLVLKPSQMLTNLNLKLHAVMQNLQHKITRMYEQKQNKINLYNSLLETLDTAKVLKRGFAIIKQNNKVISSKNKILSDKTIEIQLQDGSINAKLT